MKTPGTLIALLLLVLGCSQNGSPRLSSGSREIGRATAHFYMSREGQVLFMLWHDVRPSGTAGGGETGSTGRTGREIEIEGEYHTTDGKRLEWSCRSPDGVAGTVIVDGARYDLASGRLFVVADRPGGRSVAQISGDLGDWRTIDVKLDSLARNEPAVREIVGEGEQL